MIEEEILDKSKVDELGKLLACTQVTWMIVHVCTRLRMQLPVTTLEVTAVSHVMCALVLYTLWWHKPRKVDEPTILSGEWVGPLAALMLMCSRESKDQMLPDYQLKSEHSEMAGLKVVTTDGLVDGDLGLEGQFKFVRKSERDQHRYHAYVESSCCKNADGALAQMNRMAHTGFPSRQTHSFERSQPCTRQHDQSAVGTRPYRDPKIRCSVSTPTIPTHRA